MRKEAMFYLSGGGRLYVPTNAINAYYKDHITGGTFVEAYGETHKVRNSLEEIEQILIEVSSMKKGAR